MLTRLLRALRNLRTTTPATMGRGPVPVTRRRPVPGQAAIWRAAVQARLDFDLPAGTVEPLVRNGLAALTHGQDLTEVLVMIRRTGIRLRGRIGATPVATNACRQPMPRRRRVRLAPLPPPPSGDDGGRAA